MALDPIYESVCVGQERERLPQQYRQGWTGFTTDLPEHAAVKAVAREWAAGWRRGQQSGLRLGGAVGCGKTRVGCAILSDLIRHGMARGELVRVVFANAAETFASIQASWHSNEISEHSILRRLHEADVLFLDDLGSEAGRDGVAPAFVQERLFILFDKISRDGSPTIITASNLGLVKPEPSLTTFYGAGNGERIVSRLIALTEPLGRFPRVDMRRQAQIAPVGRATAPPRPERAAIG